MSSTKLSCGLAAFLLLPAPFAVAQPITLKTPPTVDLPFGATTFPAGPDVEAINGNCLTCHSVDHVLNQPSLSKASWEEVVEKMVKGYKAPITPEDQEKIVTYLNKTKGLK